MKELQHKVHIASKDHNDEKVLIKNENQKHSNILEQKHKDTLNDNNTSQQERTQNLSN